MNKPWSGDTGKRHSALNWGRRAIAGWPRSLAGFGLVSLLFAGPTHGVESIQVMGLFPSKAVVQIDGKRRVLTVGKTSPEGVTLVSADSESAVLEADGNRKRYKLGRRITTKFAGPPKSTAIQIWPTPQGMYRVVGSVNGYPVNFLVDTGATLIAMNRNEARRLGIDYRVEGSPSRARTASGIVNTYVIRLKRVKIGEIELRDVMASVIDGDFPSDILLGNSFLNRLEMRRQGRMLELRKRP